MGHLDKIAPAPQEHQLVFTPEGGCSVAWQPRGREPGLARLFSFESRLSISAAASLLGGTLDSPSRSHYGVNFRDCITLAQESSGVKNVTECREEAQENRLLLLFCYFPGEKECVHTQCVLE